MRRVRLSALTFSESERLLTTLRREGAVLVSGGGVGDEDDANLSIELVDTAASALSTIRARKGWSPALIVCRKPAAADIPALVEIGVRGGVSLAEAPATLGATLAAVRAGQVCFPQVFAARPTRVLSLREKQVIALVTLGLSNGEIAQRLFISESTVKSHLTSSFAKLGVRSRHEAVDLVVNPESGLGLGFLSLVPEPAADSDPPAAAE